MTDIDLFLAVDELPNNNMAPDTPYVLWREWDIWGWIIAFPDLTSRQ